LILNIVFVTQISGRISSDGTANRSHRSVISNITLPLLCHVRVKISYVYIVGIQTKCKYKIILYIVYGK